ncbi:MAG: hypothetical protein ACRDRS_15050 [Pseudonocardiaceae bacterium]
MIAEGAGLSVEVGFGALGVRVDMGEQHSAGDMEGVSAVGEVEFLEVLDLVFVWSAGWDWGGWLRLG